MATLKEVRRIIKDDGLLVVSVPTVPFYLRLIRSKWRMFIGDHYWFFTDISMTKLLRKAGFDLVSSSYISKSVDLDVITSRLSDNWQPYNLGRFGKLLRKIIMKTGIENIRITINLFDTKLYIARPQ